MERRICSMLLIKQPTHEQDNDVRICQGLDQVPDMLRGCVLTIGNFDGVHRGHQHILAQARIVAARAKNRVVVLTFEPHPLEIVMPQRAPRRLMPLEEKVDWLLAVGAETVVVAESEPRLLSMEPLDFIDNIVVDKFSPAHVVEGWSFGFGRGRKGTPELLKKAAQQRGFEVLIVDPVNLSDTPSEPVPVSSSLIRRLIVEGQVQRAHSCLGRPYALLGMVERGFNRGTTLGFPTANLGRIAQLVPGQGVYAGTAEVGERSFLAAISIGTNPTFEGQISQVEAHVLDCEEDLYGQAMRLSFLRHLRPQRKFDSPEALKRQIGKDVLQVRETADHLDPRERGR